MSKYLHNTGISFCIVVSEYVGVVLGLTNVEYKALCNKLVVIAGKLLAFSNTNRNKCLANTNSQHFMKKQIEFNSPFWIKSFLAFYYHILHKITCASEIIKNWFTNIKISLNLSQVIYNSSTTVLCSSKK